jgi:hypothetical protein
MTKKTSGLGGIVYRIHLELLRWQFNLLAFLSCKMIPFDVRVGLFYGFLPTQTYQESRELYRNVAATMFSYVFIVMTVVAIAIGIQITTPYSDLSVSQMTCLNLGIYSFF